MLYKQPNGTLKERYPELADLVTESRDYINKKLTSKKNIINDFKFIYDYFNDETYIQFKKKYTDTVYWILKEDYEYNSLVAHLSAKYIPMPAESQGYQNIIIGLANTTIGRMPGFIEPLSVMTGIETEKLLNTTFKQEYFLNMFGAIQNGLIGEIGKLTYDISNNHKIKLGTSLLFGLATLIIKDINTFYQQRKFKKDHKYVPNYTSLMVPTAAIAFSIFALNNYYLRHKKEMDNRINNSHIATQMFNEMSEMGHYFKTNIDWLNYDKIHAYPENMRRMLPAFNNI